MKSLSPSDLSTILSVGVPIFIITGSIFLRKPRLLAISSAVCLLLSFVVFLFLAFINWPSVHLTDLPWHEKTGWKLAIVYGLVSVGVLLAELARTFKERNAKIPAAEKLGANQVIPFGIDWRNIVYLLILSLIPAAGLLAITFANPINTASITLYVQDGMAWRITLEVVPWKSLAKTFQDKQQPIA